MSEFEKTLKVLRRKLRNAAWNAEWHAKRALQVKKLIRDLEGFS